MCHGTAVCCHLDTCLQQPIPSFKKLMVAQNIPECLCFPSIKPTMKYFATAVSFATLKGAALHVVVHAHFE